MRDLNKSSKQIALDIINEGAGTNFTIRDIDFANVTYLNEGYFNTKATLVTTSESNYSGEYPIEYDRINVDSIFLENEVVFDNKILKNASDYLLFINKRYDLSLSREDIVDGGIPDYIKPPFTFNIKIKENNPAFYGEIKVMVNSGDVRIYQQLKEFVSPIIDEDNRINGKMYFYGYDFSWVADKLKSIISPDIVNDSLVEIINLYGNDIWVNTNESTDFNLYNAEVIYNGVVNRQYTNKTHGNVLVISLDNDYCNNIKGLLLLHYGTSDGKNILI